MKATDYPAVQTIHGEGIATGQATFERHIMEWDEWDEVHLSHCRLVARSGDRVIGWGALSPVSGRCYYGGMAEDSVYVAASEWGKGVGKALLGQLIEESESHGIWTLQAGIFPENKISISLHKDMGFREVGLRKRLGQMDGVWRDVVLMERRSEVAGL
ncbi:GNAT family N-acetyltransferase [Candidatus Zixiibacteriota bacterium]